MLKQFRHFAIASLICVIVAAIAIASFYRSSATREMVREQEELAASLTQMFANALWPQLEPLVTADPASSAEALRQQPVIATVSESIRRMSAGLTVAEVKIYDPYGRTVFSTEPSQIGESAGTNPRFLAASEGKIAGEVTSRHQFSAFEQVLFDRDLFRSYVPLRRQASDTIAGVFELYVDVTPLQARIAETHRMLLAGILGVFGLLYGTLLFIMQRANRVVAKHESLRRQAQRELRRARHSLEEKVRQRTLELRQANLNLQAEIAERRRNYDLIREMAYVDTLTRLPNRVCFKFALEQAMAAAKRNSTCMAVMFLDLDNFKRINDTLGHTTGDELLRQAAARLTTCLRGADTVAVNIDGGDAKVARLGGDEFTVLIQEADSRKDAATVAARIIDAFHTPFLLGSYKVQVSPSIGIAYYPFDGDNADTLLKNADTAMYHAKGKGRNTYQFYSRSMSVAACEKLALENRLRKALEQKEFVLHYQPKVDARTHAIVGVEALIRWNNPETGLVPPGKFIPLAEESGLIVPISEWVLNEACRQNKAWQDAGIATLQVAVNISSAHFRHDRLLTTITAALKDSALAPQHLEIEVTESLLMDDMDSTAKTLQQLKDYGVKVAIDDFGTGYSSLNYLKRFPLDALKIDRSFVQDLATNEDDAAITNAIIAMARILGLNVVAEGVETPQQAELLLAQGCREMQGFHFGKPVPADEMTRMLKAANSRVISADFSAEGRRRA